MYNIQQKRSGGGGIGGLLGMLGGAALGAVTGGAALPAILGGASIGRSIGSYVGEGSNPAIQRRLGLPQEGQSNYAMPDQGPSTSERLNAAMGNIMNIASAGNTISGMKNYSGGTTNVNSYDAMKRRYLGLAPR